jgi:hypothetical protein
MNVRSVASDWQRWWLKQNFAIVYGKTKAVDVNPSLSARFLQIPPAKICTTAGNHESHARLRRRWLRHGCTPEF